MLIAQVIGSVVSTQKIDSLVGKKLMIVEMVNSDEESLKGEYVAIDAVGVGVGERVLVSKGASARTIFSEPNSGIDLAIVAIVDHIDK